MADENVQINDERDTTSTGPKNRWVKIGAALVVAFMLGLVPMWLMKLGTDRELLAVRQELRREQLHNSLASAAVYSRRGEYETARQAASTFFTETQAELDKAEPVVFNAVERSQMPELMGNRDDIITLLSRGDPASSERISDIYVTYRSITGGIR